MLSSVPIGPSGPPTIAIYDIHALQEQFYFSDNMLVDLKTAAYLFINKLNQIKADAPDEDIAIAFPDDGAHKRFKSKFKDYELIICSKVRDGDTRKVVVKEGDAKD